MTKTTIQFNGHSSLLIRYGDTILLTDPWYNIAFSSWAPWPPPYINPEVLRGMADKLAVSISHAHPDHQDEKFLGEVIPAEIFTGRYSGKWGDFFLDRVPYLDTAVITIRTPDCFIAAGNDIYRLPEKEMNLLNALKPKDRPSIYFGQGGSASSWPLMYEYPPNEKRQKAEAKSREFVEGLRTFTQHFDCVVPYAYQSNCMGHKALLVHDPDLMEMQPGDIYVPATDTLVQPLPTYEGEYPEPDWPKFPEVNWPDYQRAMWEFMDGFASDEVQLTICVGGRDYRVGKGDKLTCYVSSGVMAAVLDRRIPFEDLFVGYLARWSRDPDVYHRDFQDRLSEHGYRWMEQ